MYKKIIVPVDPAALDKGEKSLRKAASLLDAGGEIVLSVTDGGPGLSEAQRQRLGERFFRVLGSGASGSGLGWSIVRRIAATQGASVTTGRSAELGGLLVRVHWPPTVTVVS